MSDDAFAHIKESIEDGLAFERSERRNLNVTRIQAPGPPKDRMEAIEAISRGLESIKRKAGTPADNHQLTKKVSTTSRFTTSGSSLESRMALPARKLNEFLFC